MTQVVNTSEWAGEDSAELDLDVPETSVEEDDKLREHWSKKERRRSSFLKEFVGDSLGLKHNQRILMHLVKYGEAGSSPLATARLVRCECNSNKFRCNIYQSRLIFIVVNPLPFSFISALSFSLSLGPQYTEFNTPTLYYFSVLQVRIPSCSPTQW